MTSRNPRLTKHAPAKSAAKFTEPPGPVPGDVFREYIWHLPHDAEGDSRIILFGKEGDFRWTHPEPEIILPGEIDLEHAVRAEVLVEYTSMHVGVGGFAVRFNRRKWLPMPFPALIPDAVNNYALFNVTADVPLSQLRKGRGNTFTFRSDRAWFEAHWYIWGAVLRIYYDAARKPHAEGRVVRPADGAVVGLTDMIIVDAKSPNGIIKRVDFIAHYEDVNYQCDGIYRRWQYSYHRGKIRHHFGTYIEGEGIDNGINKTPSSTPGQIGWHTDWIPEQTEPIQMGAWVTDANGLKVAVRPATGITLDRYGLAVELCKPIDPPLKFSNANNAQRKDVPMSQAFEVKGDARRIVNARLMMSLWHGFNNTGFLINGTPLQELKRPERPGTYEFIRPQIRPLSVLKRGRNVFTTMPRAEPVDHGMIIHWPGVAAVIQYRTD